MAVHQLGRDVPTQIVRREVKVGKLREVADLRTESAIELVAREREAHHLPLGVACHSCPCAAMIRIL